MLKLTTEEMIAKYHELLEALYNEPFPSEEKMIQRSIHVANWVVVDGDDEIHDPNALSMTLEIPPDDKSLTIINSVGTWHPHLINQPKELLLNGSLIPTFEIAYMHYQAGDRWISFELIRPEDR